MDEIRFVDTTIRDGHQSLWAERMSTGMMLPIAKNLNEAGFEAIELLSGSHIKKAVRELREDPWERISRICALCPDTPMRLIAGRVNTFAFDPPCMYELFIGRMAANGIRQAHDFLNWQDEDLTVAHRSLRAGASDAGDRFHRAIEKVFVDGDFEGHFAQQRWPSGC